MSKKSININRGHRESNEFLSVSPPQNSIQSTGSAQCARVYVGLSIHNRMNWPPTVRSSKNTQNISHSHIISMELSECDNEQVRVCLLAR